MKLGGCAAGSAVVSGEQVAAGPHVPLPVACHVNYRPDVEKASDVSTVLRLTGPQAARTVVRGDLRFTATYFGNGYQGRTLNVAVRDGGRAVASGIYQLRRESAPAEDFVGWHGFTGLSYVNGRDGWVLQYSCGAGR